MANLHLHLRPCSKDDVALELRLGQAARGEPHGQRETLADAKPEPDKRVWEGKKPLTRPPTAGESAVAGHPLPKGEGCIIDGWPLLRAVFDSVLDSRPLARVPGEEEDRQGSELANYGNYHQQEKRFSIQ